LTEIILLQRNNACQAHHNNQFIISSVYLWKHGIF